MSVLASLHSLWLMTGPRCPVPWPAWTRRTVTQRDSGRARCRLRQRHVSGWFFCLGAPRAVFPSRQQGRYGLGKFMQRDSGRRRQRRLHVHGWVCWLMQCATVQLKVIPVWVRIVFWWFLLACCAEMASLTVFRLPRGTPLVMRAVCWYSSHWLLGTCVHFRADCTAYFSLSVSVDRRASSGHGFSDVLAAYGSLEFLGSEVQGNEPTNCSAWRWQLIDVMS